MSLLRPLVCLCAMVMVACAQQPPTARGPIGFPPASLTTASVDLIYAQQLDEDDEGTLEERARRIFANEPPPASELPNTALDQELLFKFLLSEIAGQRGNLQLAAQGYLEMARSTRDPRLARRATELASYARLHNVALEAARLWFEIEKGNPQARQTLVGLLLSTNKLAEAKPHLQAIITADGNPAHGFLQLHGLMAKHPDKNAVFTVVQDLAQGYKQLPEAYFAVAQAAYAAGKYDAAFGAVREAMKLRPDWELGALLQSQMLQQRETTAKALDYLSGFLQAHPGAREARANYARMLINNKQLKEARAQYQIMLDEQPANADIVVTMGLLSLQLDDYQAAEAALTRGLELNYRDPDTLRFYIGQTHEERKQYDEAMKWYSQVSGGDQYVSAQARYAFLLGRQNKLAEARAYLQNVKVQSDEQRALLIQAEAQLLREARAYQESYDLLANALGQQPENPDLLYDSALAAEKLDKLEVVEANLRKLIHLKPDHAQAYNALGYTLADRTDRLKEAKQYIEKALELSPGDAFILDSMGWVHYRLGNYNEGLGYLKRAYEQRPDAEIAAHLGEVLWVNGQKTQAEKVWRDSLQENPDNDLLRQTMQRFLK